MQNKPIHVDEKTFADEVERADIPVVVDFWAPWCGPCRMIGPVLDTLSEDFAGRVKVAKVNVDDVPSLASRFGVRGIPTLIVFSGGELVDQVVGFPGEAGLRKLFEAIDDQLGAAARATA